MLERIPDPDTSAPLQAHRRRGHKSRILILIY